MNWIQDLGEWFFVEVWGWFFLNQNSMKWNVKVIKFIFKKKKFFTRKIIPGQTLVKIKIGKNFYQKRFLFFFLFKFKSQNKSKAAEIKSKNIYCGRWTMVVGRYSFSFIYMRFIAYITGEWVESVSMYIAA